MSFDAAAAPRPPLEADLGGNDRCPPPEIRVDDEYGAAKLTPPDAAEDVILTGYERRRSMPASHNRFVDEPYVFSLSQALALSGRRRSEPFVDGSTETRELSSGSSGGSPLSPHQHVLTDQVASSGKRASAETWKVAGGERHSSGGASTMATTTLSSPDELSHLQLAARSSHDEDSDEEQTSLAAAAAGPRFLSLPHTSDYMSVPARRHSVALIQPTTSRMLDVITEETVAADSKNLASSRRYSLSCHLNA